MNIVLLGLLAPVKHRCPRTRKEDFGFAHISTGDLLRCVKSGSELGVKGQKATWTPVSSFPTSSLSTW